MESILDANKTLSQPQGNIRVADLRRWMYLHNVTFVDIGRVCGVTASAMQISVGKNRMPVRHHQAILVAWPDLPVELLPEPRDVLTGPKPKGLEIQEVAA